MKERREEGAQSRSVVGREEPWGREEVGSVLVKVHSKRGLRRHMAIGTRVH